MISNRPLVSVVTLLMFSAMQLWSESTMAKSHHPQQFLNQIAGDKYEGEKIVEHFCANCHAVKPVIQLGAPRIGNEEDWRYRLKKGFAVLFKNTEEGVNAMPAMGGCFECSDVQLKLAILALLPESSRNLLENQGKEHK
jgi:cytochrome c5